MHQIRLLIGFLKTQGNSLAKLSNHIPNKILKKYFCQKKETVHLKQCRI